MEAPPGDRGREGTISGSGQVSLLLGARGVGRGQRGKGPSQEAPIPSHTLGRGPESEVAVSLGAQGMGGRDLHRSC